MIFPNVYFPPLLPLLPKLLLTISDVIELMDYNYFHQRICFSLKESKKGVLGVDGGVEE